MVFPCFNSIFFQPDDTDTGPEDSTVISSSSSSSATLPGVYSFIFLKLMHFSLGNFESLLPCEFQMMNGRNCSLLMMENP